MSEGEKYFDQLQTLNANRGPALTAYQKALGEQPTREQYNPSIKRRLGAALIGGLTRDPKSALAVTELPYQRAKESYTDKMRNLGESANLEQDEAKLKIQGLSDAYRFGLDYDKYQQSVAHENRQDTTAEGALDVSRGNARTSARQADTAAAGQKSLEDFRGGQLKIGGRNAATAEGVARTGARNAGTAEAAQKDTAEYRKRLTENQKATLDLRGKNGTKVSPLQQIYAESAALREMYSDPRYRDFIETVGDQGRLERVAHDGTPEYAQFEKELKKRAQASIDGAPYGDINGDGGDDSDDDGSIIIEPEER
jgi:hypothetical protein